MRTGKYFVYESDDNDEKLSTCHNSSMESHCITNYLMMFG